MGWTPFAFLVAFSLVEFFLLRSFALTKEKTGLKSAAIALVFLWLIAAASYYYQLRIPDAAYVFIILSLFTDSYFGYYQRRYYKSKKYDRVQHVLGSFSFAIFFYFLFSNILNYGGSRTFRAFFVLLLGVFYGTVYEIFEFISDRKNREKMQRGLKDTDMDLISDVIGSLSASVLSYFIYL